MARTSRKKKSSGLVNLSQVEGRIRVPEGEHLISVAEATAEEGQNGTYIKWKFNVVGGDADGGILYYNTSLAPQALWNLKSLLEALDYDIPEDEFDILEVLEEFEDLQCMGSVEHETYEGKKQSRLVDFWPAEKKKSKKDEDDDKPARGRKKKDEDDEDEAPKKRGRGRPKKTEEDEDEKPSRSKRGSKKSKELTSQEDIGDMDEEELQSFIEEHELDVDLDDYKTLRKMRVAVIDAGVKEGVVEDE